MDKQTVKEELDYIFNEGRSKYLDLCKRKYSSMPDAYKKCRAAVIKRFGNG